MANTQGFPTYNTARTVMMAALYVTTGVKCALYFTASTTGPTNTVYTTTGEATGTGYTAGGVTVTTGTAVAITSNVTYWTPSASIAFGTVTIAAFDAMMLYDTGNSNRSMGVWTFGSQTVTAATFTLSMPTNDSTNAAARLTWS